jgi:lipopolysaccharide export system protein LptA
MRKAILVGVGVLAVMAGALALRPLSAQTAQPGPAIQVSADSLTTVGNIVQLRGNVEIRRGGSILRADEADVIANSDVTAAPGGIELRGNVHLTSEDHVGLAIRRR